MSPDFLRWLTLQQLQHHQQQHARPEHFSAGFRASLTPSESTPNMTKTSAPLASLIQLGPQAKSILLHIEKTGSISALDAFTTYQITSATLARRICDLEEAGVKVLRERKVHPITTRSYTRYALAEAA